MLDLAILHADDLEKLHLRMEAGGTNYGKYFWYGCQDFTDYKLHLDENNDYNNIQRVSLDRARHVRGYMSAEVQRSDWRLTNIQIVNFTDEQYEFAKDMMSFMVYLFCFQKFRKLEWPSLVDNPATKMYERFVKRCGGRVLSYHKEHWRLRDNQYHDIKRYEILREDFINNNARLIAWVKKKEEQDGRKEEKNTEGSDAGGDY